MTSLKDARKRTGMTQAQVSQQSGIPLGTLRRWEQGVNEPDMDSIIQLADLYGVSTDELLGSTFWRGRAEHVEYQGDDLATDEHELVALYRSMDATKRAALLNVARAM